MRSIPTDSSLDGAILFECLSSCPLFLLPPPSLLLTWNHRNIHGSILCPSWTAENSKVGVSSPPLLSRNQCPYFSTPIRAFALRNTHARRNQHSLSMFMWFNIDRSQISTKKFAHKATLSLNSSTRVCAV